MRAYRGRRAEGFNREVRGVPSESNDFNAGAYWQERVGAGADLGVVGHRAMGPAYNGEIYARRIDALESMLARHVRKPLEQVRVLDVGCGSGFYTRFWQAKRVREYIGVDISGRIIEHTASPTRVVDEIHRVLRHGGVFVCTFDVSFETSSPMHVAQVEKLVKRLHELFSPQGAAAGSIAGSVDKPDRVTTKWVAKEFPERLPWRNPLLVWLYDAIRGRFRSTLYRPMTFYCGTFVKKS